MNDAELKQKIAEIKTGGAEKYHARIKEQGKMFVRDRLDYIVDEGTFVEDGLFARHLDDGLPADAVVTGIGKVDGRPVAFVGNDMTVKAGTWGVRTIEKIMRTQEKALQLKIPIVYFIDSAGARLDEQFQTFLDRRHAGKIFYNIGVSSGVIPQISAIFGPSPAGSAYLPALTDMIIMVDKNTSVYIGSPRMAAMVTGEQVSMEDMGGARMHCAESGLGDMLVPDDKAALEAVKDYLSYFPQSYLGQPPALEPNAPIEGREIDEIVPEDQSEAFDMYELIDRIIDEGSFFEFKELYARELITGLARMNGRVVGILANQSMVKGGVLFPNSADKGAHFMQLCNAFNIPLLFLTDVSGFMLGAQVERQAIIRRGAKMLSALFNCTVPRISVIVRKAYGAGYVAMSGASSQSDACIALRQGKPAIMGPEAAINAMYLRRINEIEDERERMKFTMQKRAEYLRNIQVWGPANELFIDMVVPGDQLRDELINRFELYSEGRKPEDKLVDRRNVVIRG